MNENNFLKQTVRTAMHFLPGKFLSFLEQIIKEIRGKSIVKCMKKTPIIFEMLSFGKHIH